MDLEALLHSIGDVKAAQDRAREQAQAEEAEAAGEQGTSRMSAASMAKIRAAYDAPPWWRRLLDDLLEPLPGLPIPRFAGAGLAFAAALAVALVVLPPAGPQGLPSSPYGVELTGAMATSRSASPGGPGAAIFRPGMEVRLKAMPPQGQVKETVELHVYVGTEGGPLSRLAAPSEVKRSQTLGFVERRLLAEQVFEGPPGARTLGVLILQEGAAAPGELSQEELQTWGGERYSIQWQPGPETP